MEDTWLVFDFGLFKKQKAKKKKKTNFIYKVKPRIMERGETYGATGKKAGPEPIPHSEHGEVLVSSGKSGVAGTQCSLADTAQHQEFASTDSIPAMAKGDPSPKNLLLYLAGFVPSRGRALNPRQTPRLFLQFIGIRPYDIFEKPFPPVLF